MRAKQWTLAIALAGLMLLLQLVEPELLRYQQNWLEAGEIWRLISAHFVHLNWTHLALNVAGLMLCIAICKPQWTIVQWLVYHSILPVGISLLLTLRNPELDWYVGYSGVLFGIYVIGAIDLYQRDRLFSQLVLLFILGKVGLEQWSNLKVTNDELIGSPVIVDAHLYGVLLALTIAVVQWIHTLRLNHKLKKETRQEINK